MLKRAWLVLFCLMATMVASAAVEWKTFEPGVKYQFPSKTDDHFKFTPTEDGVLRIYRNGSSSIIVSTKGDDEQGVIAGVEDGEDWISYAISTWKYKPSTDTDGTQWVGYNEASLKANVTYYIKATSAFANEEAYFKGTFEGNVNELRLEECNFEQNKVFDITDTRYGQLELTFNMNADADSTTVEIGRYAKAKLETRTSTNSGKLYILLKDSINSWLNAGKISGGEEMTVTITGIHAASDASIKYGTDGTLVLKFIAPGKPHSLVSQKLPSPFLSYWVNGDENGIATLTFDSDVMAGEEQTVTGTLLVGVAENSDVYYETLDNSAFRTDGNKLYIDFTGKLRSKESMGLKNNYSTVKLSLRNIKMADGTNVYSSGSGTSGSFTFNIPFQEYKSNVAFEFTPADGGQLTENNVKLYFSEKNAIKFGGMKFTYQDTNDKRYQTIVTEGITSEDEGDDAIEYTIPITDEIKNAKNVRVSLVDVVANDGMAHEDITAKFNPGPELSNDLTPTRSSVADGSVINTFENITLTFAEEVNVNANADETAATFTDAGTGKIVYAYIEPAEANKKQIVVTPAEELKNNHKYQLDIKENVVVNNEYVESEGKYGNSMPQQAYAFTIYANFGNLDFMTQPIEGSTVNEISTINISMLPGKNEETWGITYANNKAKKVYLKNSNNEKVAEANVEGIQDGGFNITFSPAITTPDTYTVHVDDSVYFLGTGAYEAVQNEKPVEFQYTVIAAPTPLAFTASPESESTISALDQIILTSETEMYASNTPIYAYANRKVYNGVLTVNPRKRTQAFITFADEDGMPITEEATYRVEIPAGVLGDKTWYDNDGLTGQCNEYTYLYYTVGKAVEEITVTADPENGSKVEKLSTITLTFNTDEVGLGNGMITVKKNGEQVARVDAIGVFPTEDAWTTNEYAIEYEATEDGVYTFEVPDGYFVDGAGDNINGFTLTYTIGDAQIETVKATPANNSEVDELNGITVVYTNETAIAAGNGSISVKKDGVEISKTDAEIVYQDPDNWDELSVTASIPVNATEAGVYTIEIPTGYFTNADGDDIEGVTLTYYVKVVNGINNITVTTDSDKVYTLNGIKASKATKGILIVNGKKIVKK